MSGGGIAGILMIFLLVIVLFIAASCVKIVPQASAYVVESLGKYKGTWATGLHFKVPFIERVAIRVNLKEQVVDFPPQPVITKDNVTMQIDTVVFFQITDPVSTVGSDFSTFGMNGRIRSESTFSPKASTNTAPIWICLFIHSSKFGVLKIFVIVLQFVRLRIIGFTFS